MSKFSNDSNIPLAVAVHLAADTYDFKPKDKSLSATDFNKSVRQIVLRKRANNGKLDLEPTDIGNLVKSKMGTSIHDSIEATWSNDKLRTKGLRALGYPEKLIERIKFNPDPTTLQEDDIPVYMEQRGSIELDGYTIAGKFDYVGHGELQDFKSTGTWKWNHLSDADQDYRRQGSIYRLIHQNIITKDYMSIIFWFTDWKKAEAKKNPKYPQSAIVPHKIKLLSIEETKKEMREFISEIEKYKDTCESELPECSPEHLWQGSPVYKYYKNPTKRTKSTANFDNMYEAQTRFMKDGGVGLIVTVPAEAKACHYCNAYSICTQKDKLLEAGILKQK